MVLSLLGPARNRAVDPQKCHTKHPSSFAEVRGLISSMRNMFRETALSSAPAADRALYSCSEGLAVGEGRHIFNWFICSMMEIGASSGLRHHARCILRRDFFLPLATKTYR